MGLDQRNWKRGDPVDKAISEAQGGLIDAVAKGRIFTGQIIITNGGAKTGPDYWGKEIRDADPDLFQAIRNTGGNMLKKDVAGGTGTTATRRGSWRVIALFHRRSLIPGYEFYWKHKAEVQRLAPDFRNEAQSYIRNVLN